MLWRGTTRLPVSRGLLPAAAVLRHPPRREAGVASPWPVSWPFAHRPTALGCNIAAGLLPIAIADFRVLEPEERLPDVRKLLADAQAERAELRSQLDVLAAQCSNLAAQVQHLSQMLQDQANERGGQLAQTSCRQLRPTVEIARSQPTHVSQLDNDSLFELALGDSRKAHKERLIREIMRVDGLSWEGAHRKLYELDEMNERHYWSQSLPYRVGVAGAIISAVAGSLMVFWKPLAQAYASEVVGEPLPEGVSDISEMTTNQVGSWTWGWMEPMLGTASFVLLCFQFARAQAWKMNMRPYTEWMLSVRGDRLARHYPQYDPDMVRSWAKHMPMVQWNFFPTYRRFSYKCNAP